MIQLLDIKEGFVAKGKLSNYTIKEVVGGGANKSFKAVDDSGNPVFLKVYDAPRKTNERFKVFWNLQEETLKRLRVIENITEKFIEHFLIDDLYYCSVKEFVKGKDLEKLIEEDLPSLSEIQALGLALVYTGVLKMIHEQGIVHSDLKPEQVFCVHDPTIKLGWVIKIVDFDFAIIEGMEPFSIVGTPLYFSPEHLKEEQIVKESDIFTSGIVLTKMLIGGYVYDLPESVTNEDYKDAVLSKKFNKEVLEGIKVNYVKGEEIVNIIMKMLEPDKTKRPSLDEVRDVLMNAYKAQEKGEVPAILELVSGSEMITIFEKSKLINRKTLRIFGRDKADYASRDNQFVIEKTDDGWKIKDNGKTNPTFLNGSSLAGGEAILNEGDTIEIGPLKMTVKMG